jgi:hypothetical protein
MQRPSGPGTPRKNGLFHLLFRQSAQIFLTQSAFVQKFPEHVRESRIPIVVLTVDLLTTLRQVTFQVPQIRRLLDLAGYLLYFLNHLVKLSPQGSVEGCAGDQPF